jgi:outer membrane protein TolC
MDYQGAQAQVRAAELARRAAGAGRLPSVSFNADYGTIGRAPANSHGTFTAGGALTVPIFQGGRVRGEKLEADAALEQRRAETADLRARIAYEVRTALLDVEAARQQVEVARSAVDLARQQVTQASDRFAAGVTNNLEVVQAQQALAAANESHIASLYAYNLAKTTLARAIGNAEKGVKSFVMEGQRDGGNR